jgi:hypothetical protein
VNGAIVVRAYSQGGAYALAIDDDGGLGRRARHGGFRVGIIYRRFDLTVVAALECSGPLLFRIPPYGLDLHQLGTGGDLTVDMVCDLGLEATPVQAFVRNYVGEECGVVSATPGAGGASSGGGVQGRIFPVERRIVER